MNVDWVTIIAALVCGLLIVTGAVFAWRANASDNNFSILDYFTTHDGKASFSRLAQFVALILSTWAVAFLTLGGRLTEGYLGLYMATWAATGITNKWMEKTNVEPVSK